MTHTKHSVASDDSAPCQFLVGRHWWILESVYADDQGRVHQIEGRWSPGHPVTKTFDLSEVRDSTEIAHGLRLFEAVRGAQNQDDPLYLSGFAADHKPGCPSAIPEIRANEDLKAMGGAPCKCSEQGGR